MTLFAALLTLLLAGCGGGDSESEPETRPSASAEASPTPSLAPLAVEPLRAEIYATPEQVVAGYHELRNEWINAGSTPETIELVTSDPTKSTREHAAVVAAKNEPVFAEAIFTSEALGQPQVQELVRSLSETQVSVIDAYSVTLDDPEPYRRSTEIVSIDVISSDATSFTARVEFINKDNVSRNNAEAFLDSAEGISGAYDADFVLIDGVWRIASLTF